MRCKSLLVIFAILLAFTIIACDEVVDPEDVTTYTEGIDDEDYDSAMIYVPAGSGPFPATTLSGGWTNTKEQMEWIGYRLAKQDFIVICITPDMRITALPPVWERGHNAAVQKLKDENQRYGSPIYGKVDTSKLGLCGFSMGGGGVIMATQDNVTGIKATIAMAPWEICTLGATDCENQTDEIDTPIFLFGGSNDVLAWEGRVADMYEGIPSSTERLGIIFNGMSHFDMYGDIAVIGEEMLMRERVAEYMIAFFKVYLADDSSYMDVIDGLKMQKNISNEWFTNYDYNGIRYFVAE